MRQTRGGCSVVAAVVGWRKMAAVGAAPSQGWKVVVSNTDTPKSECQLATACKYRTACVEGQQHNLLR